MKSWSNIQGVVYGGVILFCLFVLFANGNAGDKGWILYFSQLHLEGRPLYSGIFSALPPLIFWLDAIPAKLATLLPLPPAQMLALFAAALSALSILVARYMFRKIYNMQQRRAFTLLLVFMFFVWSHALYFGDREHLFLVLVFPYLLRFMPSLATLPLPLSVRLTVGSMAAVGFCIKPHCVLVFAVVQLLVLYRSRKLSLLFGAENNVIYLGAVGYFAAIAAFAPEYYSLVLPMSMATYAAASDKMAMLFYGAVSLLILAAALADFRRRDRTSHQSDIYYFMGIAAGFLLYALTNNGWGYSWNPLNEILLFLTGLIYWQHRELAAQNLPEADMRRHRFGMRACSASFALNTLVVLVLYGASFFAECDAACKIDHDMQVLVQEKKAASFGSISINFARPATLAETTDAVLATRFNHLWMLPQFFVKDEAFKAKHQWILDYVAQGLAQDLQTRKPVLVFVDDTDMFYAIHHNVDLIAYLSEDTAFRAAWSNYRFLSSIDYCDQKARVRRDCKYDVYERVVP